MRRRCSAGKRLVSEKKRKNTFGTGVTSLTASTKSQPYKAGDEVPIQITVKNSTNKAIAQLMVQMEAQEVKGEEVTTKKASWVEYFQDGAFPLEGGQDYEGEIMHALPPKMTRVTSENFEYRLAVQLKFKGFPPGKITTYLPLFIVEEEEWNKIIKEQKKNGHKHNNNGEEKKTKTKTKDKKKGGKKKKEEGKKKKKKVIKMEEEVSSDEGDDDEEEKDDDDDTEEEEEKGDSEDSEDKKKKKKNKKK